MSSAIWIVLSVVCFLVVLLVVGGALALLYLRASKMEQLWTQAWSRLDASPQDALKLFDSLIQQARQSSWEQQKGAERLLLAYLGKTLCLARLQRFDEALRSQAQIWKLGTLPFRELTRLCRTYLDASPGIPPPAALDAFARYLHTQIPGQGGSRGDTADRPSGQAWPSTGRSAESPRSKEGLNSEMSQRIVQALQQAMQVSAQDPPERVRQAYQIARNVVDQAPHLDWAHHQLGLIYYRAGRFEDAVSELEIAVRAAPDQADRQQALGRSLRKLDRIPEARAAFLEAYRLSQGILEAFETAEACLNSADVPFTPAEKAVVGERTPLQLADELLRYVVSHTPQQARGWLTLGHVQWKLRQSREALISFQRALAIDGRLADAHYLSGRCYLELGHRDYARQALTNALMLEPEHQEAARWAGDLAYADGRFSEALGYYEKLGPDTPTTSSQELLARIARCHLEAGNPRQAETLLTGQPLSEPTAYVTLARSQARQHRWADALRTLQSGHQPGEAPPEFRYYLGTALAANGELTKAEEFLTPLCSDSQWRELSCRQLGHLKLLQHDYNTAKRYYAAAHAAAGKGPLVEGALDLARLYLAQGDADAAREQLKGVRSTQNNAQLGGSGGAKPPRGPEIEGVGGPLEPLFRFGLALADAQLGETEGLQQLTRDPALASWAHEGLGNQSFEDRRYLDALTEYEAALQGRRHVPTSLLSRLASAFLQLGRYREALPHLVELARRLPKEEAIQYNQAVCRFHLGQTHFRRQRWDQARAECKQARQLLESIAPQQAKGIHQWELEASYRAGVQLLGAASKARDVTTTSADPGIALRLFQQGCEEDPGHPRWWFGAALAHALAGQPTESVRCFEEAYRRVPNQIAFTLGHGLSLQKADQTAAAREKLRETIQLGGQARGGAAAYPVAARFALAMSHARDRQWDQAADTLEPLLQHPLIRGSQRIGPGDVAQAMVAYYGLAGQRDRANELATQYLPQGSDVGDVLLGVFQAESGDYAGAAETLAQAYQRNPNPSIKKLIVGCLLAAAAEHVKAGDFGQANTLVEAALGYDARNSDANRLSKALSFCTGMRQLKLTELDDTLQQCETLVQQGGASSQLKRTLGVLYHRKALDAERRNRSPDDMWQKCLGYWRKEIFSDDGFWETFAEEYNTGKSRRDRVKSDDIDKWRKDLPMEMASGHASYIGPCLRGSKRKELKRHMGLIWEWAPDYVPPEDFLVADLGEIDDKTINLLEELVSGIKAPQLSKTLGTIVGGSYNGRAVNKANRAGELRMQAVGVTNAVVGVINELIEKLGPMAIPILRTQARPKLEEARDKARQAQTLVNEAKSLLQKARQFAPDLPAVKTNLKEIEELADMIRKDINTIGDLISQLNRAG